MVNCRCKPELEFCQSWMSTVLLKLDDHDSKIKTLIKTLMQLPHLLAVSESPWMDNTSQRQRNKQSIRLAIDTQTCPASKRCRRTTLHPNLPPNQILPLSLDAHARHGHTFITACVAVRVHLRDDAADLHLCDV